MSATCGCGSKGIGESWVKIETYVVVWVLPVRKTGKSLNDFYTFPSFGEGSDRKIIGEFLGSPEKIRPPKLAADHDKCCKKERAFVPHVGSGVQGRVKEVDERVETEEEGVEEGRHVVLGEDTSGDGVFGWTTEETGADAGLRGAIGTSWALGGGLGRDVTSAF